MTDLDLSSLKPGDKVGVVDYGGGYGYSTPRASVGTVEKVTDTQVVVDRVRFNRTTGRSRGDRHMQLAATDDHAVVGSRVKAVVADLRYQTDRALGNVSVDEADAVLSKVAAEIEAARAAIEVGTREALSKMAREGWWSR